MRVGLPPQPTLREKPMSSTRTATDGILRQERFCSAPEFEGEGINGLAAAKRIEIEADRSTRELLWFIQWRSLAPRGLQQLCSEIVESFPDRIDTPLHVQGALADLPHVLTNFCLNPKANIRDGFWFFDNLYGALRILRDRFIASARERLADTVVSREIIETLDFWYSRRRMVLIEGVPGTGRSETTGCWVNAHVGMVRFVEVPSSNDDRSFFASIARQLGVARGASMKAQEIKVRIEEMLARSELMLAFDESQYLWAQYLRPRKTPDRLLWIKSIFDSGTPVALVALTDFSMWQAHYVKRALWPDEQFERRVNRAIVLVPDDCVAEMRKSGKLVEAGLNRRLIRLKAEDLRADMLKIARVHFPEGDTRCWKLLASYAVGAHKKLGGGIREALESARYRAEKEARDCVTFGDIEAALIHDHGFLKPPVAGDAQPDCRRPVEPLQKHTQLSRVPIT